MTAVIQDAPAGEAQAGEAVEGAVLAGEAHATPLPLHAGGGRPVTALALLEAYPGNARRRLALDEEFIASVWELGILTPLRVSPGGDCYRVIEGHRRLAAAIEVGLAEVPYDIAADRADDGPGQFLDMFTPPTTTARTSPPWRRPTRCSPRPPPGRARPASAKPPDSEGKP